jgi:2'-5' RNA ligase
MRAFVAVPIGEQATERVAEVQRGLRGTCEQAGWKVSWVRPENLHLTLKFLGEVEESRIEEIREQLGALEAYAPFDMQLAGVGAFPPARRPRVIWIGVEQGAGDLRGMALDVEERMETIGFSREKRPFRAHLTVGRVKQARTPATGVLDGWRQVQAGTSHVREVVLYQSTLHPQGARYSALARIPLRGLHSQDP